MKSIKEADVKAKKVLVRAGFDVLDKKGNITNYSRLHNMVPTLKYLVEQGAKVIVISHNGRPKGNVVPELSMKIIAEEMSKSEYLGKEIAFVDDCVGDKVKAHIESMNNGDIVFLENLRFHEGEK